MTAGALAFVALSINPIGGALISVPYGMLQLHYSPLLTVATAVPLGYVQVIAVDIFFHSLQRIAWWRSFLEKRRSARIEELMASGGGFWLTFIASAAVGPYLVMTFMRLAHVPQRRVALPILLSLGAMASLVAAVCRIAPGVFHLQ